MAYLLIVGFLPEKERSELHVHLTYATSFARLDHSNVPRNNTLSILSVFSLKVEGDVGGNLSK